MEEKLLMKKLENVDRELHVLIDELKRQRTKKMSLSEIRELLSKGVILDVDPTKLIREMRDKEYGL